MLNRPRETYREEIAQQDEQIRKTILARESRQGEFYSKVTHYIVPFKYRKIACVREYGFSIAM